MAGTNGLYPEKECRRMAKELAITAGRFERRFAERGDKADRNLAESAREEAEWWARQVQWWEQQKA